jgi:hypothetical protein
MPNVPVVYLGLAGVHVWAQFDTGYDDIVYPRSVDINEALYDRLVKNGVKLERIATIDVWTCDGRESRPVYRARDTSLIIENEGSAPIARSDTFHLIVKSPNGCGGIAEMSEPAAQLGASFLQLFHTVIFDPKSATVWLGGG